jgi:DNA-binding NtrC family response regulator
MPGDLQVRLLRVLETSAVTRVGGAESLKFDVRIIAATNRRPERAVAEGRLRQDLLYRLNVFPIELPPLRERGRDVLLLAEEFLGDLNLAEGTAKRFTAAGIERLLRYTWPGNVRELRNVVHRAFILAEEDMGVDCVVPCSLGSVSNEGSFATAELRGSSLVIQLGTSLAVAERRLILAALDHFEGDKPKAAQALGISVKTVYNRLREYKADSGKVRTAGIHEKVVTFRRSRVDGARSRERPPGP